MTDSQWTPAGTARPNWPEDDGKWRHDCNDFQHFDVDDGGLFWAIYDHHPGVLLHGLNRTSLYASYVRVHQEEFPDCLHACYIDPWLRFRLSWLDFADAVKAKLPRGLTRGGH